MKYFVLIGLLCLIAIPTHADQLFKVGLIENGRSPYFKQDENGDLSGIYIRLIKEIAKKLNYHVEFHHLPQPRIRLYMEHGELNLEPGISPRWRKRSQEKLSSVYSIPFMESHEVIIHRPNTSIDTTRIPASLQTLKGCSLLGFDQLPGTKKNKLVQTEKQLLKLIDIGRCDYAIMPKRVFHHFDLPEYHLTHTKPILTFKLHLRLHKSQQAIVPKINNIINELKESGRLENIINTQY
ncbi:MAG: substrate-binding periplasmic protein [Parashewanella sp.]